LSCLILGTIHFSQGDLKKAQWDFKKALDADEGANAEKAKALLGMGRIASIEGDTDRALELYRRASKMEPESRQAYVSQAVLLDREGRVDEALALFNKARSMSPGDPGVEGLARETQEKAELLKSKEKQEKVDRLVKELIDHLNNTAGGATSSDDWTSPPLTLWIMDLESVGHGMQEGEERLIASGMTQQLIEKSRVQIVDRAIFDKLLEELKLSRTKLVDPSTALSLGRVMAARLISTGKIVRAGAQTQVALRLIETETGRVVTAVSGEFANPTSASAIAESLVGALSEKIDKLYPLRGKIVEARENGIVINIGRRQGVQTGQAFKVIDTDAVLEVSAVEADHSILKSTGELTAVKPGLRVEALDNKG
jgi:tetratricopeptide (TPR) repeat protein